MSCRLVVMRHAKSSWDNTGLADHDRPLNRRGRREAPVIAEALLAAGWAPSLVLCSSATRTQETWDTMAFSLPSAELRVLAELYGAGIGELRPFLADIQASGTVLVLGHNPGWEGVVNALSGEWVGLTTANAVLLESDAESWLDAVSANGRFKMVEHIRARELDT